MLLMRNFDIPPFLPEERENACMKKISLFAVSGLIMALTACTKKDTN